AEAKSGGMNGLPGRMNRRDAAAVLKGVGANVQGRIDFGRGWTSLSSLPKPEANVSWAAPAAHDYLRGLAIAVLCWTGVIALESSQVFVSDASRRFVLDST